jgi:uncharacterized membrane protein
VSEALIILYVLGMWVVLLLAIGIALRLWRGRPSSRDIAYEELRARWARGELTRDEYQAQRGTLDAAGDDGTRRLA